MKEQKEIKKFNAQDLRERKDKTVSLKLNEKTYKEFQKIMKEQDLTVSGVINQFMTLTNDLLKSAEGGEVVFIFEPNKDQEEQNTN